MRTSAAAHPGGASAGGKLLAFRRKRSRTSSLLILTKGNSETSVTDRYLHDDEAYATNEGGGVLPLPPYAFRAFGDLESEVREMSCASERIRRGR